MTTEDLRAIYNETCREWLDATEEEREAMGEELLRKQTALIDAMEEDKRNR